MKKYWCSKFLCPCLVVGVLLLLATVPVTAAEPTTGAEPPGDPDLIRLEDLQYILDVYLWGASIDATSPTGADVSVGFSELFKNLNGGIMGVFGVSGDKWSVQTDLLYMDVEGTNDGTIPLVGGLVTPAQTQVDMKGWVVTPTLGYKFIEMDRATVHGLIGARYLSLDTDLNITTNPQMPTTRQVSDSAGFWDAIFGIKGKLNLVKKFYLDYYLDVGTGQTDLTWQGYGGLAYRFNPVDITVGYRYLKWDFKQNPVFNDLAFHGPLVGFKFLF